MASMMDQLERIPEPALLVLNAAMGGFVLVAHGGALLLMLSGKVPVPPGYAAMVHTIVPFTLPVAALVVVGSALGALSSRVRSFVLCFQAIVLFGGGIALLGWATGLVFNGIPPGNFAWTPGFLTGWVAYSAFLCSRFAVRPEWKQFAAVRYWPIICAVGALPVDVGVLVRFVAGLARR
jgi:hypothetical protein